VIHYHGTPITPRARLLDLVGRHFCVSFARPDSLSACLEIGQSVMLDNGAFSAWRRGGEVNIDAYARWVSPLLDRRENWCVIPDVIDGTGEDNDALLSSWSQLGVPRSQCAPVWHMHESIDRLVRLCAGYNRVCIGSSGEYATIGDTRWHRRMRETMDRLCGNGPPPCWLHMLRGLSLAGSEYPFASADSTNVAQNGSRNARHGRDDRHMVDQIDGRQCAARWVAHEQRSLVDELRQCEAVIA
jgi:hypothetical protein